jgi:hypothetical protein
MHDVTDLLGKLLSEISALLQAGMNNSWLELSPYNLLCLTLEKCLKNATTLKSLLRTVEIAVLWLKISVIIC